MGQVDPDFGKEGHVDITIKMGKFWRELLLPEFDKPYMTKLYNFIADQAMKGKVIYPYDNNANLFRALELADYNAVKVVILGQDPYHGKGQANGLAFSVNKGVEYPPSLKNIAKELGVEQLDLEGWAKQGVLLLNTSLTVNEGEAGSHAGQGWETFTDKIIELVNEKEEPCVFMLWGNHAKAKKALITGRQHLVLEAAHPSPLSAHNGFFGCNHFFKANDFLVNMDRYPVRWV